MAARSTRAILARGGARRDGAGVGLAARARARQAVAAARAGDRAREARGAEGVPRREERDRALGLPPEHVLVSVGGVEIEDDRALARAVGAAQPRHGVGVRAARRG